MYRTVAVNTFTVPWSGYDFPSSPTEMLSSLNVISYFWLPQLLATTILLSVSVELITPGIVLVQSHSVIFCGDIRFWCDLNPQNLMC